MDEKELLDTSILVLTVSFLFIFMKMKELFGNDDTDYKSAFIAAGVWSIILAVVYAATLNDRPPSIATVAVLAQVILNMVLCQFLSQKTTVTVTTIPTVIAIAVHYLS